MTRVLLFSFCVFWGSLARRSLWYANLRAPLVAGLEFRAWGSPRPAIPDRAMPRCFQGLGRAHFVSSRFALRARPLWCSSKANTAARDYPDAEVEAVIRERALVFRISPLLRLPEAFSLW